MSDSRPQLVFIVGTGRSGSSILHELLGYHPEVGWMSSLCDRSPYNPGMNRRVLSAMRLPMVGPMLRRRYEPHECYRFFDVSFPGFSAPVRDLGRTDVPARVARDLRRRLPAVVPEDRSVLVVKFTGWPRIGFLAEIFPTAKFIHLVRDGRAVANSLLRVPWWHGWQGPQNWRFGPLAAEHAEIWQVHGRSFPVLAALEWMLLLETMESSRNEVSPEQFLAIRYEDLCTDSTRWMEAIVEHMGLEWSPALDSALRRFPLRNQNEKWREDLGDRMAAEIDAVLAEVLTRYGYGSGSDAGGSRPGDGPGRTAHAAPSA